MRIKLAAVLVVVVAARVAHAEPPTLSPVPLTAESETAPSGGDESTVTAPPKVKKSYGVMIGVFDALGVAALVYGISNIGHHESQKGGEAIAGLSAVSLVLMSPMIHAGHGNGRGAIYSLLLRGATVPFIVGVDVRAGATAAVAVFVFDWLVLAKAYPSEKKSRSKRLDPRPRSATSSLNLVPTIIADGPGLVLGGRF